MPRTAINVCHRKSMLPRGFRGVNGGTLDRCRDVNTAHQAPHGGSAAPPARRHAEQVPLLLRVGGRKRRGYGFTGADGMPLHLDYVAQPVPAGGGPQWAAADPAARPTPWRRHPRPRRRGGSEEGRTSSATRASGSPPTCTPTSHPPRSTGPSQRPPSCCATPPTRGARRTDASSTGRSRNGRVAARWVTMAHRDVSVTIRGRGQQPLPRPREGQLHGEGWRTVLDRSRLDHGIPDAPCGLLATQGRYPAGPPSDTGRRKGTGGDRAAGRIGERALVEVPPHGWAIVD
jgi:hypothetical protein